MFSLFILLVGVVATCNARHDRITQPSSISRPVAGSNMITFGTGLSQQQITTAEREIFNHTLSSTGEFGTMTHWWATGDVIVDFAVWRYYVDGETTASIQFASYMAAGVGFADAQAPWGNRWIGKQAAQGGWYNNFRIPFHKSVRVTAQLPASMNVTKATFWTIVRGTENLPTIIGDVTLPSSARLVQSRISQTLAPLDTIDVINVESGSSGVLFFHTLSAQSANLNFLEGCYHAYNPRDAPFPGLTVSTGTEDYFVSAFYFNAGEFHGSMSGFTHRNTSSTGEVSLSAYRFHDQDPIFFNDGFRFTWRNGDVYDEQGFKCTAEKGTPAGNPQKSRIDAQTWAYVW